MLEQRAPATRPTGTRAERVTLIVTAMFPEPSSSPRLPVAWNAHVKDALEYRLLTLVRAGKVDLHTA